MLDIVRFLGMVRHYHLVSQLPARDRLGYAQRRLRRLQELARDVPFYQDRVESSAHGDEFFPPFTKTQYHKWDLARRINVPDPEGFADKLSEALEQHAAACVESRQPIRPFRHGDRHYLGYTTSGSSGRTIVIAQSLRYLERLLALQMARGSQEQKSLLNIWRKYRNPPRWAVLLRGPGAFPGISLLSNRPDVASRFVRQRVFDIASLDWDQVRHEVETFSPEILTTYPSTLATLAEEKWNLPDLKLAVAMSEPFSDTMKQTIREHFPHAVLGDHYATGECPILTTACPAGHGAHINDDVVIFQPTRKDGTPCAPGELSDHVLISDLLNEVQPFINYRIEDNLVVAPNEGPGREPTCDCGSRQPRVVKVLGRNDDRIELPSGFVLGNLTLRALVTRFPAIVDYQLVYARHDGRPVLQLNLVMQPSRRGRTVPPAAVIADALSQMTPERIECVASLYPSIPADSRTGKVRRFVNLAAQPQTAGRSSEAIVVN